MRSGSDRPTPHHPLTQHNFLTTPTLPPQDKERAFLKEAFARVQTLEAQRVKLTSAVAASLADGYKRALAPLGAAAAALAPAAGGAVDGEAELAGLHRVALAAGRAAEALAARQADATDGAAGELFCSPEILRQGAMELWDAKAGAWSEAHCVLTRAGFLHWFASMDAPGAPPLGVLNLARCQFEAGEAPVFNLVEGAGGGASGAVAWLVAGGRGGGRKVTFKAPGVDECCEWASERLVCSVWLP